MPLCFFQAEIAGLSSINLEVPLHLTPSQCAQWRCYSGDCDALHSRCRPLLNWARFSSLQDLDAATMSPEPEGSPPTAMEESPLLPLGGGRGGEMHAILLLVSLPRPRWRKH